MFGNAFTIAPAAIGEFNHLRAPTATSVLMSFSPVCGITVSKFKVYKPQNYIGWALTALGIGLLSLLKPDTPKGQWVGFQIIEGFGLGFLYPGPTYPIQAPLPVTQTAHALALFVFVRAYSQTWGVQIGATILQNQLNKNLPAEFIGQLGGAVGGEVAYSVIPIIPSLPEPLRGVVREAFAKSLKTIWTVMAAFSVVGFLAVVGMKELKMHEVTDDEWGMEKRETQTDAEKNKA